MDQQPVGFEAEKRQSIRLPQDFLQRVSSAGLSADALLDALLLFQVFSLQESDAQWVNRAILAEEAGRVLGQSKDRFDAAMKELLSLGMLLQWQEEDGPEWLLPGNPEGRSLLKKLASSSVNPSTLRQALPVPLEAPQNIFALYEANIGVLTPLIAEQLKEDQNEYPLNWIQEAVAEALLQNVRNWKYVRAILKRWKTEGRSGRYEEDRDNRDKFRELYRGEQPDRP